MHRHHSDGYKILNEYYTQQDKTHHLNESIPISVAITIAKELARRGIKPAAGAAGGVFGAMDVADAVDNPGVNPGGDHWSDPGQGGGMMINPITLGYDWLVHGQRPWFLEQTEQGRQTIDYIENEYLPNLNEQQGGTQQAGLGGIIKIILGILAGDHAYTGLIRGIREVGDADFSFDPGRGIPDPTIPSGGGDFGPIDGNYGGGGIGPGYSGQVPNWYDIYNSG